MKMFLSLSTALAVSALVLALTTQTAYAQKAADQGKTAQAQKWGAFDDDGDGVPNCQDPDYVRPKDGTGKKLGQAQGAQTAGKAGRGQGLGRGLSMGPRAGSGTGTGTGTGICDGTGPKGKGRSR